MAKDTDQIVVGANGTIRVAPVDTAMPATSAATFGAGWVDLGYASEDGVTLTDSKDLESIPVWQLFYPARRIVTGKDLTVAFVLRQWSSATVSLAFGGGEVTWVAAGQYQYEPPAPETIDERALAVDWIDGDKNYRLLIPKGMVTENVETNITRTAAADLPITFGIIGTDDAGAPWTLLTDDPAFETLVSA
jgi:hypothetical protein